MRKLVIPPIVQELIGLVRKSKTTWAQKILPRKATKEFGFPDIKTKFGKNEPYKPTPGELLQYSYRSKSHPFILLVYIEKTLDTSFPGLDNSPNWERGGKVLYKLYRKDGESNTLISDDSKVLKKLEEAIAEAKSKRFDAEWKRRHEVKASMKLVPIQASPEGIKAKDLIMVLATLIIAKRLDHSDLSRGAKRALKQFNKFLEDNFPGVDNTTRLTAYIHAFRYERTIKVLKQLPPDTPLTVKGIWEMLWSNVGNLGSEDSLSYTHKEVKRDIKTFFGALGSAVKSFPTLTEGAN